MGISPIEQNYQYGLYGQGGGLGKLGGLTTPRINPPTTSGNEYGISIPSQVGYVNDQTGNKISLGQDGVGLAHRNPQEYNFMGIA